jgi:hypothetical protein
VSDRADFIPLIAAGLGDLNTAQSYRLRNAIGDLIQSHPASQAETQQQQQQQSVLVEDEIGKRLWRLLQTRADASAPRRPRVAAREDDRECGDNAVDDDLAEVVSLQDQPSALPFREPFDPFDNELFGDGPGSMELLASDIDSNSWPRFDYRLLKDESYPSRLIGNTMTAQTHPGSLESKTAVATCRTGAWGRISNVDGVDVNW